MASAVPLRNVVYMGTFIHCLSLDKLEVLENAAIGVNDRGLIIFVEKNVEDAGLEQVMKHHPWREWDVVKGDRESTTFFFPGFVGECGNVTLFI